MFLFLLEKFNHLRKITKLQQSLIAIIKHLLFLLLNNFQWLEFLILITLRKYSFQYD